MKSCPVCDTDYPDEHSTCPTDGAVLIESEELAPGSLVRGKYRIVCKLGRGGMGIVYLAEHLLLGRHVALKFLASELSRNPLFIKRFRNEARAAFRLRSANIAEVMDLDQAEDGSLFIAMEYVEGESLRAVLEQAPGELPIPRALAIARGIAAGLAAAHAQGIVHRDIKPENILLPVAPDGSEHPKILDFGIAAMLEGATSLSVTRGLMLTPQYAAPEQWRGMRAGDLDGRTDLYALGGVLYEMLTHRTPFQAENMEGWMYEHLHAPLQAPAALRGEIASFDGLNNLVVRLLARDRDHRPATARDVLAEISRIENPPPSVHPKTVLERRETVIEEPPTVVVPKPPPVSPPRRAEANRANERSTPAPELREQNDRSSQDKASRTRMGLRLIAFTRFIAVPGLAAIAVNFGFSALSGWIVKCTLLWNPAILVPESLLLGLFQLFTFHWIQALNFSWIVRLLATALAAVQLAEGVGLILNKRWPRKMILIELVLALPFMLIYTSIHKNFLHSLWDTLAYASVVLLSVAM
ncbi:MAG TPA: protein kinase, partial [Acidobacteriaceae bacterium]